MERLRGATVIVTGAARGIGAAYAMALAAEGANVVIADILDTSSVVAEITSIGGNAIGISCDVTDNASVDELVSRVVVEYGKIDALINNAAIFAMGNPVALLAKAEDLLTLGFISITTTSPLSGFTANCILLPPVATPISLIIYNK